MNKKIGICLDKGTMSDYEELERILKTAAFKTAVEETCSNPNGMGIDWGYLMVIIPAIYPCIVEFRKTICSYLSYKESKTKEFSIVLENNGKKLEMSSKNVDTPNIDEFMKFFDLDESKEENK